MLATLFESYPLIAGLLIAGVSLFVGAIEMEVVKSRGPVLLTWVLGGMAMLAPLASSTYSVTVKVGVALLLLGAYVLCARWIWKKQSASV